MDLYQKFVGKKKWNKDVISASTVKNYFVSQFLVYCDRFVSESEKDEEDPYIHEIMDYGLKHEKQVYSERYAGVVYVKPANMYEGFKMCIEAMSKGASVILNLNILDLNQGFSGAPDVLRKVEGKSVFGDYHYVVEEIKSAKHFKHKYIMQAAFYNMLIGKIQGYTPDEFFLINRDNERRAFLYSDYEPELSEALAQIRKIFSGKVKPLPDIGEEMYPWRGYSLKAAEKIKDISLVNGVGKGKKELLFEAGIKSVEDMAEADINELEIKGLGIGTLRKYKLSAQALLEKKHIVFGKVELPSAKHIIFFDFEGTDERTDELEKMDYLIGCLIDGRYIKFVAEKPDDEANMMKEFLEWISKFDDFVLYHYGTYEKTALKRICYKYNLKLNNKIMESMFDLLNAVRNHVAFPTYSNSLKDIAPYLGFKWRSDIAGQDSILLYRQYLKDKDRKKLQKIFDYNEDDCRATEVVKKFLEKV